MNLESQLELLNLAAGGPGSGRHPWGRLEIKKAITRYTKEKGHNSAVNNYLRKNAQISPRLKEDIEKIREGFQHEKVYEKTYGPTTMVYRGVKDSEFAKSISVGKVITEKGFMSTSTSQRVADAYSTHSEEDGGRGTLLAIQVPEGTKYIDPRKNGRLAGEREYLFPPGTKLKIVSVKKTLTKSGFATPQLFVKAKMIPSSLKASADKTWIGVDFDGTLVKQKKFPEVGEPITKMVSRVKKYIAQGKCVKVFTARAVDPKQVKLVEDWTEEHLGKRLEVTNEKDHYCVKIIDNIAHKAKADGTLSAEEELYVDYILSCTKDILSCTKDEFIKRMDAGGPGSGRHAYGKNPKAEKEYGNWKRPQYIWLFPEQKKLAKANNEKREHYTKTWNKVKVPLSMLTSKEKDVSNGKWFSLRRDNVDRLKQAMKQGKKLPYITVTTKQDSYGKTKSGIQVEDGHHRTQALKELGYTHVVALIHPDDTKNLPKGVIRASIEAGGPGSGRHAYSFSAPVEVLSHHGFENTGKKTDTGASIYKSGRDVVTMNHKSGVWIHYYKEAGNLRTNADSGLHRLDSHLARHYGNEKYSSAEMDLRLRKPSTVFAGGPGSGRKPYGRKDHEELKKQIKLWKKEIDKSRNLSPMEKKQALENKVFLGWRDGQAAIDHLKEMTKQEKDSVAKEFLNNIHEQFTEADGKTFNEYNGNRGTAHSFLKDAEQNSKGVTDKLHPGFVHWIKSVPASKGDDNYDDDIDGMAAGGPGSGRHPWGRKPKETKERVKGIVKPATEKKILNKKGWTVDKNKSEAGKKNAVRIAVAEQVLAEDKIQKMVAKAVGGQVYGRDSEPVDVVVRDKQGKLHGIEVKGVLAKKEDNARMSQGKLQQVYMGHGAVPRKMQWAQNNKAQLHTVIVDVRGGKPVVYHAPRVGSLTFGDDSRAGAKSVSNGLKGLRQKIFG